jgi:hypothetical protein
MGKILMGTYKILMGTYKFMMGTYKFMMGTYTCVVPLRLNIRRSTLVATLDTFKFIL